MKKNLVILCGPSGVGKTSVLKGLLQDTESLNRFFPLEKVTTRIARNCDSSNEIQSISNRQFNIDDQEGRFYFKYTDHGFDYALRLLPNDTQHKDDTIFIQILPRRLADLVRERLGIYFNIAIISLEAPVEVVKSRLTARELKISGEGFSSRLKTALVRPSNTVDKIIDANQSLKTVIKNVKRYILSVY